MGESLKSELVHAPCPQCGKITSFSFESLLENPAPICPYCGETMPVDLTSAKREAERHAHELDQSVDSLGSME
jgi:predicted RNA-binding Zn-ribbon protein involved in translation (DUF1610 family)